MELITLDATKTNNNRKQDVPSSNIQPTLTSVTYFVHGSTWIDMALTNEIEASDTSLIHIAT